MKLSSKEKLIEATIFSVAENGLHSVTTAMIAKEAGYSEAMIYKHFGNKETMVVQAFLHIKDKLNEYVNNQINNEVDFDEQCHLIWLGHVDFFVSQPQYLSTLIQFEHSKYMTEDIYNTCLEKIEEIVKYFTKGVEIGKFRPMDIEVLTVLFFSPILAFSESVIHKRIKPTKAVKDMVYNATMRALAKEC